MLVNHPCCQITSCNNNSSEMRVFMHATERDRQNGTNEKENGKCMLLKLDKRHEWQNFTFFISSRQILFGFFTARFVFSFILFPLFLALLNRLRWQDELSQDEISNVEILSFRASYSHLIPSCGFH